MAAVCESPVAENGNQTSPPRRSAHNATSPEARQHSLGDAMSATPGELSRDSAAREPLRRGLRKGKRERDKGDGDAEEDAQNPRRPRLPASGVSNEDGRLTGQGTSSSSTAPVPADAEQPAAADAAGTASTDEAPGESAPARPQRARPVAAPVAAPRGLDSLQRELAHQMRLLYQAQRREDRELLCRLQRRLGRFKTPLVGSASERQAATVWEGGLEAEALEARRTKLQEQKQQIDELKKSLQKPKKAATGTAAGAEQDEVDEEQLWETKELIASKITVVNREEQDITEKEKKLKFDRVEYSKKCRTIDDEDKEEFGPLRMLEMRYQLLRLLGKGSRSSAYRAYDLISQQFVMVRIHKKVDRETAAKEASEGVKALRHPCIAYLDHYFVDKDTGNFVTVWEFCEGESLECFMRRSTTSGEKEVKGVALQILSALKYLEQRKHTLDVQDLRTSHIVIRGGEVKICGLTLPCFQKKIQTTHMHSNADQGAAFQQATMVGDSLASEETQEAGEAPGLLLDPYGIYAAVFQIGNIVHEMIFDKKPESSDADEILSESAGINIPDSAKISVECKQFLISIFDPDSRTSASEAYSDPFVLPAPAVRRQGRGAN